MEERIIALLDKKELRTGEIADTLGISRPTALKYLKELESKGLISKFGNGPQTFYASAKHRQALVGGGISFSKIYQRKGLQEYDVFQDLSSRFLRNLGLPAALENVLSYAFTEMLNNAIDHSRSGRVRVTFGTEGKDVFFSVRDFGVGIFANLKNKLKLGSELEGAQEMTKGKVTTDPERHTGQGVFFTSRVADRFVIRSHLLEYEVENKKDNFVIHATRRTVRGTEIIFRIRRDSVIHLTDIFRQYEDEDWNFSKTEIKVTLFAKYAHLVSRSQAKMILSELDKFSKIIFDFKGVDQIGQGFADEIFRVFQKGHPGIVLEAVNTNANVAFMVNRAKVTQ